MLSISRRFIGWFFVLPLFLCGVVLAFSACEKTPGKLEKITLAFPQSAYSSLMVVAYTKNYFRDEGLEVAPQAHEFGKIAFQSMLEAKADLAISGDTVVMFALGDDKKVNIIAETMTSKRNAAVIAQRKRGIKTPLDLAEKKIGVAMGTTGHFFLDSFLEVNGIDKNKVRIIDMRPHQMKEALARGTVDAVAVWQPHIKKLERELGDKGIVFYDERIYSDIVCLSALREFVKTHPETIKKVLRALIRAESFIKEHPDEARQLIAEFLRTDKSIFDEIWDSLYFQVTLDQSLVVSLEDQNRWARERGYIKSGETPNYLDFIYADGLEALRPSSVRIIR